MTPSAKKTGSRGRRRGRHGRTIAWDSCLLISWITGEIRADATQTAGLEAVRKEVDDGDAKLVISTLARSEVFRFDLSADQKKIYNEFCTRKNVIEQDVTGPIAEKAAEIRRATRKVTNGKEEFMKTPDAIHLATAIIMDAAEFQTWDGTAKKPRPFPLIPLSGSVIVDKLKIVVPAAIPDPQEKLL